MHYSYVGGISVISAESHLKALKTETWQKVCSSHSKYSTLNSSFGKNITLKAMKHTVHNEKQ